MKPVRSFLIGTSSMALACPATLAAQDNEQALAALASETAPTPAEAITEALELTADGDLLGAAATLESALLADPNANDARLVYAATLCRLGDVNGAGVEIAKLNGQDTGNNAWAQVEAACGTRFARPVPVAGSIHRALSGEVYGGIAMDSDALGAIALDTDFGGGEVRREPGLAAIWGARLGFRSSDYGTSGGIYATGSLTGKRDIAGPDQRYWIAEGRAGWGRDGERLGYSVGVVRREIRIFGDRFQRDLGGQAEVMIGNVNRRIHLRGEISSQRFDDLYPTPLGNGTKYDLSAALEGRLGPSGFYLFGAGGEVKNARRRELGYGGARLFGAAQIAGQRSDYWNVSGSLRYLDYHDADNEFTPDRRDWRGFARLARGVPVIADGMFLEGALSYTYRRARYHGDFAPGVATYRSAGLDTRLVWKF